MKIIINGENTDNESFDLKELTFMELKGIHHGLSILAANTYNNQFRALAATIHAAALKDREITLNNPTDFEKIKKHNKAMMKSLSELRPVSTQFLPF